MRRSVINWLPALSALSKTDRLYSQMSNLTYYDRLRLYNQITGPDWAFRLHDLIGHETIMASRPSWLAFYRDDIYNLHLPLDPRAPETDKYLGQDVGAKEFAFYAAMGFDGYEAALRTPRIICSKTLSVTLDDYHLEGVDLEYLTDMRDSRLGPEQYYHAYGDAIGAILDAGSLLHKTEGPYLSDERLESMAAACVLFLCGGHQGCSAHVDEEEAQRTRIETIILSRYAAALARGEITMTVEASKAA